METKELEKNLEDIKGRITANRSNAEKAEKRRLTAAKKLEDYQSRYENAREERQSLLASGKDVKKINESIKIMQTDKELAEDEVIGLDKMLIELGDEAKALEEEERETGKDILRSKLLPLVPAYNEAAAKLAAIVEKIWELRLALNERPGNGEPHTMYSAVGWDENALETIPKLFEAHAQIPGAYHEEAVHFSYRIFSDKKRKEREKLSEELREKARQVSAEAGVTD